MGGEWNPMGSLQGSGLPPPILNNETEDCTNEQGEGKGGKIEGWQDLLADAEGSQLQTQAAGDPAPSSECPAVSGARQRRRGTHAALQVRLQRRQLCHEGV